VWLADLVGGPIDEGVLSQVVHALEEELERASLKMHPDQKAHFIAAGYAIAINTDNPERRDQAIQSLRRIYQGLSASRTGSE